MPILCLCARLPDSDLRTFSLYPFGLSPRPVIAFAITLVVLSFRGFPEFGDLASIKRLDGYIIDLCDEIKPQTNRSDYTVFPKKFSLQLQRQPPVADLDVFNTFLKSALYGAVQNTFNLNVLYGSTLAICAIIDIL